MTRRLHLDLETRSVADLRQVGVYRYAQHPTTDVILACWRIDEGRVHTWWRGEPLPDELRAALLDPETVVVAHNAGFERILLRYVLGPRYGWPQVPLDRWDCTMARARACALPGALEKATAALGLRHQKDMSGHRLMLQMCRPRRLTVLHDQAVNLSDEWRFTPLPDGRVIEWWGDQGRLQRLADYCAGDVLAECGLDKFLPHLQPTEKEVWACTERMNDRGVRFDLAFVNAARQVADEARALLDKEMRAATAGLVARASNVAALKSWLKLQGVDIRPPAPLPEDAEEDAENDAEEENPDPELRRSDIERLLKGPLPDHVRRVLRIRLEAGKTSTRKLESIRKRADADGWVHGLLGYHGASTGRYAATGGVQIQNFPRDVVKDWEALYAYLLQGAALVDALFGAPLDIIAGMLRGAIIPADGCDIANADYAAVEACGVAWLAGQTDLVEAFRIGAKIYERMAARIFGIPESAVLKDSLERFIGKQVVLGCGYQMGAEKFQFTCGKFGVDVDFDLAHRAISIYRDTYPRIPALWYAVERGAILAVQNPGMACSVADGKIVFRRDGKWLRMKLPSGRYLRYRDPAVEHDEKFNKQGLTYWGINSKTKKWGKQRTYGGRLTENAVQAICRDLMVLGLLRLEAAGYQPATTVHDEIINMPPHGFGSEAEMCALMCELPEWAAGFPLAAEGRRAGRYSK